MDYDGALFEIKKRHHPGRMAPFKDEQKEIYMPNKCSISGLTGTFVRVILWYIKTKREDYLIIGVGAPPRQIFSISNINSLYREI